MPFQPGHKLGGRSKEDVSALTKLKVDCRKHAEEIVTGLIDIFRHGDSSAAKVKAAEILLDRGFGKAQQFLEITNGTPFDELTTDELRTTLETVLAAINRLEGVGDSPSQTVGSQETVSVSALH